MKHHKVVQCLPSGLHIFLYCLFQQHRYDILKLFDVKKRKKNKVGASIQSNLLDYILRGDQKNSHGQKFRVPTVVDGLVSIEYFSMSMQTERV